MSPRPRVALVGEPVAGAPWSELAVAALDLVATPALADLAASGADYGMMRAETLELAAIARQLAQTPQAPPLVLLLGPRSQPHPHASLLRDVLRAKRQWETAFDAIVDPLVLLDAEGRVVRGNAPLARALGRELAELPGVHYTALLGGPASAGPDPIAASQADGQPRTEEARYLGLPGIQQVTTSPVADGGGKLGLAVMLKDMTAIHEAREGVVRAARLSDIGQLAAGVAHEINTPLASIALRAESLLRSAGDPRLREIDAFKNFPRYLTTIHEETFRCKKIIAALLAFSSSRKREALPVDLNAIAQGAADLVGHQMQLRQVTLVLQLDPELPTIVADDGQLRQVLIALLMNALDASPAASRVTVETARIGAGRVLLAVADEGAGIPAELRDKIFNPFFTTKPPGEGTGLGLAICHGIVAGHGGEIEVESEPGKGTRVRVSLPCVAPEPRP